MRALLLLGRVVSYFTSNQPNLQHMIPQSQSNCIFCHFPDSEVIVHHDSLCYAIISQNPINQYHVLVIPHTHQQHFTELPTDLVAHLFGVAQQLSQRIQQICHPDAISYIFDDDLTDSGYNIVAHFKIHLIPRFKADLHLIDWSKLRKKAVLETRKQYAQNLNLLSPLSSFP